MENVAFDLPQYYPPVPLPPYATGEVKEKPYFLKTIYLLCFVFILLRFEA